MEPSAQRQRRRSAPPLGERSDEFLACLSLYETLTWRFSKSAPFLPRTLRRGRPRPTLAEIRAAPTVRYVAGDEGVKWQKNISRLRCLWCSRRFYRFADEIELLLHLRTCHGRFKYELEDNDSQRVENAPAPGEITMRLLEGREAFLATGVDRLSEPDEESLYVNPARYGAKLEGGLVSVAGSKRRFSLPGDGPTTKRHRPTRACATTMAKVEDKKPSRRSTPTQPAKSKTARSRGTSTKAEKGYPCYASVEHAVKEKRLWHSILQNPLSLEEFRAGDDSDDERDDEHEWRLRLADDEVEEFEDTLPVEKLLMNLWNQFLLMEYNTYADHRVAPACKAFAKKYRRVIHNFNLEVTFLRHLTELGRIGLLDSDVIAEIGIIISNRDKNATPEEKDATFLFAERIIRQAEEEKNAEAEKNGRVRVPNGKACSQ